MAQQFEALKPGETDAVVYYFVTNQENFKQYLTNKFFVGAKYGDTLLHSNIKIVVFPTSKNTEDIKEHCKVHSPDGVRLANFKIFMPDQASESRTIEKVNKKSIKQENQMTFMEK